jgi:hypothetical protein
VRSLTMGRASMGHNDAKASEVWLYHCHLLEYCHHDMLRADVVLSRRLPTAPRPAMAPTLVSPAGHRARDHARRR